MTTALHHFAAIYETRLIEDEKLTVVAPPVKLEVITGPAYMHSLSTDHAVVPLRGEVGEEVQIPSPSPIQLEEGKRYIIASMRAPGNPVAVEEECRRTVERITAIIGLLSTPTLFALPIHIGWVSASALPPVHTTFMFSHPQKLDRKALERGISVARKVLTSDSVMRDRFDLIARLFGRTIGMPPSDEAFLWAWTCLEIFPMMGTQKYRHIAPYLAKVTGSEEAELAERLDIRGLHALRSKLVHSGHLGLSDAELFTKLGIVRGI